MASPKSSAALLACIFVALTAQPAQAQSLTFFKNYFVTGDYTSAGIGLDTTGAGGRVSGVVNITDASVPEGAEALAAFLYWQVVSSTGPDAGSLLAKFNGQLLSTPTGLPTTDGPLGLVGNPAGTQSCPLTGGGSANRVYAYRADVLRFLDVVDGRHRIKGAYTVELPDGGGNSQTPRAIGASLVVIYRHPDPNWPLNAIVMYDGNYTKQSSQTMSQNIQGYYDPAAVAGKMTHITGSAQSSLSERLRVPGAILDNAFRSAQGASWDNLTVTTASPTGASFVTSVEPRGLISDCLTWGAIVYRTQVKDADEDGLLDAWELSTSVNPLFDPHGGLLPALADMGAQPNRPDVFVELAYLQTTEELTYGGVAKPVHTHLPTYEALRKVGQAFSAQGIALHVDVGNNYQDAPSGDPVHIINVAQGARGGESWNETLTISDGLGGPCVPDLDRPWVCQFNDYPGTVGWKSGFRIIKDSPLFATGAVNPNAPSVEECEAAERDGLPETVCERVFDSNRKDMFRFVLSAHALGIPKKSCLVDEPTSSSFGFPDFACQDTEPLFHVPVTNTGVGDFLGGDAMVTLGGFNDSLGRPVGTDYMQGATLAHELGHGMGLRHGAFKLPSGTVVPEPNCKPNYLSVMNYLFQLRGLQDDLGVGHVNFSGQTLPPLDETGLSPNGLNATVPYRTGWYAPKSNVRFGSAATKHCDGSPLLFGPDGEDADTDLDPLEPAMVRVDSKTVLETGGAIDWDNAAGQGVQDANFDGEINHAGGSLNGFNDWENIRLNQVGSRRNVGGWYWVQDVDAPSEYYAFVGPLSIGVTSGDLGKGDLGKGDLGKGDLGKGDLGKGDLGKGDLGKGDLGKGDLGKGDLGKGDLGKGDLGKGDLGAGDTGEAFELDADIAAAAGFTPPTEVKAFVRGTNGTGGTNSSVPPGSSYDPWVPSGEPTDCTTLGTADCHRVRVDWKASNSGLATGGYRIFRVMEGEADPVEITFDYTETLPGEFTLFDTNELPNGVRFTYFVTALFDHDSDPDTALVESSESNPATVTAVNVAPLANPQSVADAWEDIAVNILLTAFDPDSTSLTFSIVTGPSHGGLTGSVPSVTYTPTLNYNVTDGSEGFTFKVRESSTWLDLGQDSLPALVDIPVNPVNDAPSFSLKTNPNQSVAQPAGAQTVASFAVSFSPGPLNESAQLVAEYLVSNNNNALFSVQPAIAANGTLTYTPAPGASGTATVSVRVRDNGGVDPPHGGVDTSGVRTFTITITNIVYVLDNVKNLPSKSGTTYKPSSNGTMVELSFKLKKDGELVDSKYSLPRITIKGPSGSPWAAPIAYAPGCTTATTIACHSFKYGTSDKLWNLQWKPVNAPVGTYYVIVWIDETGQRFPATGDGFPVVFKK
jgi:hypothetical protein